MAVRGVYTDAEKEMLAIFDKDAEAMSGWAKSLRIRVASEGSIKGFALATDPWNPLWRDENYAVNTRWGGIIALPMYQDCIALMTWFPEVPPDVGFPAHIYIGEDWEFFKPVRVNDSFKVWRRRPQLVDITSLDGKELRTFKLLAHDVDVINQRDELVNTIKLYLEVTIMPEPPKRAGSKPDYTYTKEELEFIDRATDEEEIRGADIRYWEDVSVGEKLRPVVMGPTTLWDMLVFTAGRQELDLIPMMEVRKRARGMLLVDPDTGVTHLGIEMHLTDLAAQLRGRPHGFHYGAFARQLMARLVTNWIGDDGFIRRFNWRHLSQTPIGDTLIGRGKVTNKRVENGEHLVDLAVWLENMRGYITEAAVATVSLCSKEVPYTWK